MGGGGQGDRSWAQTRVETAVGSEACTLRSRGRCSLLCVRVREATHHGEAMAARPTGVRTGGPAQEKGSKAQPRLQGYGARVLGCTHARGHRSSHERAREHKCDRERAGNGHGGGQDGVAPYG
jgi:hypothetical protein